MATGRVPTTANSPLTAKGDLFGYSTTQARVAVGNDGEQIVADSSTSTGLRYTPGTVQTNPVINSAMQVWQRGTTIVPTATTYGPDRWQVYRGTTGSTVTRQLTNDTTNLPSIQYCARVQRDSGNTATNPIYMTQSFETINSIPYAGKTVTFSFYARAGANFSSGLAYRIDIGTGTDQNLLTGYTSGSTIGSSNATLTTTWVRYSVTATITSTSTEFGLLFGFVPTGTAGANDYFEVTGVQLDVGSVALPFRTYAATIQGELSAAQRYYYRNTPGVVYGIQGDAIATSTTAGWASLRPPVRMRIAPSAVEWGNLAYQSYANNIVAPSAITVNSTTNTDMIRLDLTMTAVIAGHAGNLINNNNAAGFLGFSAEL